MAEIIKKSFIFFTISILFLSSFFLPTCQAENNQEEVNLIGENYSFKAEVVGVVKIEEKIREDGSVFYQQDLRLRGLEGKYKDREIFYEGISDLEIANANFYEIGDKVFVDAFVDYLGQETFYVVEFVRSQSLMWLAIVFIIAVLLIGRFKGFKALVSLVLSFVVIIKFILPQILLGRDPFLISLIGGLLILILIIYITEGMNRKSHISILSVLLSLIITLILASTFTKLAKLTGTAQEETIFLINIGKAVINFQGLLLAGFIIGAIGVLDDIIVGQVEAVDSLREANPALSDKKIFSLAYRIGNTHLGAIVNTLFLTYAGAALPLLLLFIINQEAGLSLTRVINTEIISTEIVRTLVGSIGVMLSMPIATFLASFIHSKKII